MAIALLTTVLAGCQRRDEVVVYCALDREFSKPILDQFESRTGVRVLVKYDTESTKSVGLTQQILREKNRPVCDVFWNNEVLHTIRLANAGLLAPYASPVGREYPASLRSEDDSWFGFAARARILIINTDQVADDEIPARLEQLTDPKWSGRVGIAKPLFGTTATQIAALFASRGPDETKGWLRQLKANDVRILPGNKQVAVQVGSGALAMGLTDTDDALAEIRQHRPVRIVFIESGPDDLGVLFIPNTVCRIRGGPHPEQAKQLIDFLLSPETENQLARGEGGQIPCHPSSTAHPELDIPVDVKRFLVDFGRAASIWNEATQFVKDEFTVP